MGRAAHPQPAGLPADRADAGPRCLPRVALPYACASGRVLGCAIPQDLAPWCGPLGELEYPAACAFAEEMLAGATPRKLADPAGPDAPA